MTPTQELKLACLQLATTYLSNEPHNFETLLGCAKKFYNYITEQLKVVGHDEPYKVLFVADKGSEVISREWLNEQLENMLRVATESLRDAGHHGNPTAYQNYDGQCNAFKAVINLVNPKEQ